MAKKESLEIEHLHKKILDVIVDGVWVANKNDVMLYTNKGMERIAGVPAEQLVGKRVLIDFSESTLKHFRPCYLEAKETLKPVYYDTVPVLTPANRQSYQSGWLIPIIKRGNFEGMICTVEDITDLKKADILLKESEASLANAQRITHLGNWDWDIVKNELYWSDEIYRIFNINKQEFGDSYDAFLNSVHPDDRNIVQKSVDDALYENQPYSIDHRILLPDGSTRFVHEQAEVTFDEAGKAIRMSGTIHDITERKQMEQELRRFNEELEQIVKKRTKELKESEEKYKALSNELELILDNIPALIFYKDLNNNFVRVNKYVADGYKTHKDSLKGKSLFDLHPKEVAQAYWDDDLEIAKSGKPKLNLEEPWETSEGKRWIMASKIPITGDDGRVNSILGISTDITERKKMEEVLYLERDNFVNILNSMVDGVYIVDQNYNIEFVNQALLSDYGPVNTKKCYMYFHDRSEVCPWCKNQEVFGGKTVRWEWYSFKNQKTYDLIDTPMKNYDGSVSKLEIFRDITERKLAGQKLKESEEKYRKAYEQANFFKDLFVHDMGNILNALQMSAELYFKFHDKPEKINESNELMGIFKSQLDNGTRLISNVRTLSKLDENKISLKEINVYNYIEEAKTFTLNNFQARNINIIVRIPDKNMVVQANDLLLEVFRNILNNAVKYNDNPIIGIYINVSKEQKEGMNYMKLEFRDNGQGISNDRKRYIFQKGHEEYKGGKGMGIGLSLVKKIIESYKGKIWVEDKVKGDHTQGSNFIVLLLDCSKMIGKK